MIDLCGVAVFMYTKYLGLWLPLDTLEREVISMFPLSKFFFSKSCFTPKFQCNVN